MKQLSVRGIGDELVRAIRRLASRDETSLNRAAVKHMPRAAGMDNGPDVDTVGLSLDHLIGRWSDPEADEVEQAPRHFKTIDEAMWK